MKLPLIIQGGMGVAVSSWQLANAVSRAGQLGVVSGTGIALVLVGRLQDGDSGGHVRRALAAFPDRDAAQAILDKYYVEGGLPPGTPYDRMTLWTVNPPRDLNIITVIANFVEVWLAKEGHDNPVGINLLEKVQMPNMASLYGAMLAGVDVVIMGAGIPMQVPGLLENLKTHQPISYRLDIMGGGDNDDVMMHFDPQAVFPGISDLAGPLQKPIFLPIVSSVVLALALKKRANGPIDGFVIEMPTAGGHNAPPRGQMQFNEDGEPVYTEKDAINLQKFRDLGLPFWLAGGFGSPEKLVEALAEGASGIQVGTAFAYCDESGMAPHLREYVLAQVLEGEARVRTDPIASPTGFPFKVVQVSGTVSDADVYARRERICDVGFLRHLYRDDKGKIGYRCPAEPIETYVKRGGEREETVGRVCLCNQLGAAAGFPQVKRDGSLEPAIVTSGDDLPNIGHYIRPGTLSYSAQDVIDKLLSQVPQSALSS